MNTSERQPDASPGGVIMSETQAVRPAAPTLFQWIVASVVVVSGALIVAWVVGGVVAGALVFSGMSNRGFFR